MAGGGQRRFWRNALRVRAGPRAERSWIENPSVPLPPHRRRWLVPDGADASAWRLLAARALRAFADGYMALLLPAYLLALGLGTLEVGIVSTATMLGSALATLAVGAWGHRFAARRLLRGAALLMVATGVGFAGFASFWPLARGRLRRHAQSELGRRQRLPAARARAPRRMPRTGDARTALFARYSVFGALCAALGALAAGVPDALVGARGVVARLDALRGDVRRLCARSACSSGWLYRRLPRTRRDERRQRRAPAPLGPSRGIVVRLAALFSVDAFAGGLVVNSLLVALAARALRPLAGAGRRVLLLDRPAERRVAARGARGRRAHRPAQHDGLHAHPGQRLPGAGRARAQPAAGARRCCSCAARCRRWTCRRAPPT